MRLNVIKIKALRRLLNPIDEVLTLRMLLFELCIGYYSTLRRNVQDLLAKMLTLIANNMQVILSLFSEVN